jgi:Carboxypeptidase regulatory-like domain
MKSMTPARSLLAVLIASVLFGACGTNLAAKDKDNVPESSVSFVVLKDDSGKPIRNAAVVLHPVGKKGKQANTGFELKTDPDGKTHFDGIPYGPLRIQVIAPGFQTFGDDFTIGQPSQEITIRLKRPQAQYSIYDKHDGDSGSTSPK